MGDSLLMRSFRFEIKLPLLEFALVVRVKGVDSDIPSWPEWCPRRPLCGDWWGEVKWWGKRFWSGASEVGEVGYPESLGSPRLMPTSSMFSKLTRGTSIPCVAASHSSFYQPGRSAAEGTPQPVPRWRSWQGFPPPDYHSGSRTLLLDSVLCVICKRGK